MQTAATKPGFTLPVFEDSPYGKAARAAAIEYADRVKELDSELHEHIYDVISGVIQALEHNKEE